MDHKQQAQELLIEIRDIIDKLQTMEEYQKQEIMARIEKICTSNSTDNNINDQ
jgi:hypothetical protein